ncbi:hypothetical protein ACQPW3_26100 [Actinosynnema sp. CA-248983]
MEQRFVARARLEEVVDVQRVGPVRAQRGLEHVVVGVHEAGQDDLPGAVEHLGVAGREVAPDRDDGAVLDQDVAAVEVPDVRVHAQHDSAAQDGPGSHGMPPTVRRLVSDTP